MKREVMIIKPNNTNSLTNKKRDMKNIMIIWVALAIGLTILNKITNLIFPENQ